MVIPFVRSRGEYLENSCSAALLLNTWTVFQQLHSLAILPESDTLGIGIVKIVEWGVFKYAFVSNNYSAIQRGLYTTTKGVMIIVLPRQ